MATKKPRLSVAAIRRGRTNRRNPTLTEHAAQILPYRGLGSGIPRALGEWPRIELLDDVPGNQFSAVAQRPVSDPIPDPVSDPVDQLLQLLRPGPLSPAALLAALGLKHRQSFRTRYLRPALASQWIEMTLPDTPNSRLQRYRLTPTGRARAESDNNTKRED